MFHTKSRTYLLLTLLSIGFVCQEAQAKLQPGERFLVASMIGVYHGLANKLPEYLHYKQAPHNASPFRSDWLYELMTFILAHGTQHALLEGNDFMSLFGHGLGQAVIESYNPKTDTVDHVAGNWTLVLAACEAVPPCNPR